MSKWLGHFKRLIYIVRGEEATTDNYLNRRIYLNSGGFKHVTRTLSLIKRLQILNTITI